ncbi:sensor histidine kinase [Streptomyces sp. V1I1]|uniref:sensor histidine kinase n=1 Tax=Streptomyces sp. V1I1 TaxID=3042272 RepID=UPI00278AF895|nr:sensor histidine kinase [Streptomyces sp. V1I1]MDQ0945727.1 signal transduction histidine kinase [Streptomyces sp. V1I1]
MRHLTQPKNWRVRNKLTAVVLIPGLLAGVLAAVSLSRTINDVDDYGQFSALARLQQPALRLVHALQDERDVTAGFIAGRRKGAEANPRRQRAGVDTAAALYRQAADDIDTSHDLQLYAALRAAAEELRSLPALRTSVDDANLTQSSILAYYTTAINRLMDLGPALAAHNGGSKAARQARALNALSRAVEHTSRLRADLNSVLTTGTFLVGQFPDFAGAVARQQESVDDFLATANGAQQTLYADTVKGVSVSATQAIQERAAEQAQAPGVDVDPATWRKVSTHKITLMREVESQILDHLITLSGQAHASRQSAALSGAAGLLAVFLATGWVVTVVVRSMTRPLKTLRISALQVANQHLPAALTRLRQADIDDLGDYRATPTAVASNDEIGEVAEAFDAVQNAAVALVKDQAALRAHINGMFIHLSSRNQHLVSKLLTEIGDMEQHEANPDHLARLFRLDHLATQMLRTDESLLVLAGSDTGRRWQQPMPLPEILLAASAEVEQYTRIDCRPAGEVAIAADAVTDLVHLLAELMENATVFSGAGSRVTVTCRLARGHHTDLVISIEDQGSGMTAEYLATVNHRLASTLSLDPGAGQSMGLFVVGRLAAKHGIGVHLIPSPRQGTTALVRIPRELLARPRPDHTPGHGHATRPSLADSAAAGEAPAHPSPVAAAASPAVPALPLEGEAAPAHGGHRTTDAEPAFGSPQEWLDHRRFAEGLHASGRPSSASLPSQPNHSPTSSDTRGNLPTAEGQT